MADNPVDKLKQRMAKATQEAGAKESPNPPQGGGSMSGERENDARGQGNPQRDVAAGPKSHPEKVKVAEQVVARAKAEDVEDTREETSGDERHDLVIPTELNIPPTIVQERLRMGQNPSTGEPWTREERMRYDRQNEQARQEHARAVRESEEKMRREQSASPTPVQPMPHVPTSFLTDEQKRAMQEAQDRGEGPIAQARARDAAHPDEIGKRQAEEAIMTEQERKRQEESGVDPEIERHELGEDNDDEFEDDDDDTDDEDKDADEVEKELDDAAEKNRG